MYISRYAVNSWGIFYLEAQKGYSTLDASFIISISSVCGIVGTMLSGVVSDRLFKGRRNVPALIFGLTNTLALCLFLLVPGVHFWLDALAMVLFGIGIGVLICFLGGLMAVDIAPRNASGAAFGCGRNCKLHRCGITGCDEWCIDRRAKDCSKRNGCV